MILLWTILLGAALAWYFFRSTKKPANFPNGPPRLPFVGSLPFVVRWVDGQPSIIKGLEELALKYSKVFGFYRGRHPVVNISDYDLAKDILWREQCTGRPPFRYDETIFLCEKC